jgi:hypothetical protein
MLVMIVLAVAFVSGMGYLCSASVRLAASSNFVAAAKARSAAESALEHATRILYTAPETVGTITQSAPVGPYVLDGNVVYRFYFAPGSGTNEIYTPVGIGGCGTASQSSTATVRVHNKFPDTVTGYSPEAYWRLGEQSGTAVTDQTGRHGGWYHNGVALKAASALVGANSTSASFDGGNDYADVGTFNLAGSAMTVAAWVKPSTATLDGKFVLGKTVVKDANTHCWSLGTVAAAGRNQLAFRLRTNGPTDANVLLGGTVTSGTWTFAAAVYDGNYMILYQDGNEVGRCVKTGSIRTDSSAGVWIANVPPSAASGGWPGSIDEPAVFTTALAGAQVSALYACRNPVITILSWSE